MTQAFKQQKEDYSEVLNSLSVDADLIFGKRLTDPTMDQAKFSTDHAVWMADHGIKKYLMDARNNATERRTAGRFGILSTFSSDSSKPWPPLSTNIPTSSCAQLFSQPRITAKHAPPNLFHHRRRTSISQPVLTVRSISRRNAINPVDLPPMTNVESDLVTTIATRILLQNDRACCIGCFTRSESESKSSGEDVSDSSVPSRFGTVTGRFCTGLPEGSPKARIQAPNPALNLAHPLARYSPVLGSLDGSREGSLEGSLDGSCTQSSSISPSQSSFPPPQSSRGTP